MCVVRVRGLSLCLETHFVNPVLVEVIARAHVVYVREHCVGSVFFEKAPQSMNDIVL